MRKKVSITAICNNIFFCSTKPFIVSFFVLLSTLLCANNITAQGLSSPSENLAQFISHKDFEEPLYLGIQANLDTMPVAVKPKLLPDNMSLMEKGVWGEKGFLRWIGLSSPLTPDVRKHELGIRRTMLSIHQIGGFATLGLMLATCYYGQKIIDGGPGNYSRTKNILVNATIISYSLTAALSILSPPPLIRRDEASTTSTHKLLAWFHVAGMIVTPILGTLIAKNHTFNIDSAHVHQISGYITTALFATSMIVITF
jgi:hypothetical protein